MLRITSKIYIPEDELIERASQPPKRRKPTKPTAAAKRRRLEQKKVRGRTKALRKPPE